MVIRLAAFIFCLLPLFLQAAVQTELFWRLGDDGWRYRERVTFDSSGWRRELYSAIPGGQFCFYNTNNPAPDSHVFAEFDTTMGASIDPPERPRMWEPATNNIGFECWVKPYDFSQTNLEVCGLGTTSNGWFYLDYNGSNGFCGVLWQANWWPVPTNRIEFGHFAVTDTNEWIHVALVRDSGVLTLYTNSVAVESCTNNVWREFYHWIWFGGNLEAGLTARSFKGGIDEFRIFTFTAGGFSTNDLLYNSASNPPQICGRFRSLAPQEGYTIYQPSGWDLILRAAVVSETNAQYYWYKGGAVLSTNPVLVVSNAGASYSGLYRLIVTNSYGASTSATHTVSVQNLISSVASTNPSLSQIQLITNRYGCMIHYGIGTFMTDYPDHDLSSDGSVSPSALNPTALDVDQWIRVVRDCGMRFAIIVAKHHDGFCLWDTAYTSYGINNMTCPNRTDIVKEAQRACAKYNIGLGLYYSLWDKHDIRYSSSFYPGYISYVTNQVHELMTKYGAIQEIWFDGPYPNGADVQYWHWPEIYHVIKSAQPDCRAVVNWGIGTNSIWLEEPTPFVDPTQVTSNGWPMIFFPADARAADPVPPLYAGDYKLYTYPAQGSKLYYLPYETVFASQTHGNWFWHSWYQQQYTPSAMSNLFVVATANSNAFIVDLVPDTTGQICSTNIWTVMNMLTNLGLTPVSPPSFQTMVIETP